MAYIESDFTPSQNYDYAQAGSFKAPPAGTEPHQLIAWLQKSLWYGQQFLQSNTAASSFQSSLDIIANRVQERLHKKLSKAKFNRLKRSIREIISTLTNINPRWSYSSNNEEFKPQAEILNKRLNNWWGTSFADRSIKQALQWACLGGGYLSPQWSRPSFGGEQPDHILRVFGTMDVIPDQIHRDGDIQKAYAVHIRDTMPYALSLATFPEASSVLVPDRFMKTGAIASATRLAQRWIAPIFQGIGMGGVSSGMQNAAAPFPEVDVYYTYIADQTVNSSPNTLHTDEFTYGFGPSSQTKGTRWEYTVPPLGSDIPDGTFRDEVVTEVVETGQMIDSPLGGMQPETQPQSRLVKVPNTRIAGREDSKLYPLRRLIIWTATAILYDGPSPWWHGLVPVVQLSMDKWHWEFLGFNIVEENRTVNEAQNSLLRGFLDQAELSIDPPTRYIEKEYSRKTMDNLNLRVPGTKMPQTGLIKDSIAPVFPYQHHQIQPQAIEIREFMKQEMDYQLGVQDMSALAKLQQAPAAETIDRLMQAAGPIIHDYAREMERTMTAVGYMFMWNTLEFDTTSRRMQIFGRDGITTADWDFQPGSLIPDNVAGVPGDAPLVRKALLHGRKFTFNITPMSIYRITDIQNKLFYLQLWRDPKGFPIDPWTVAQVWNLPNFGEPPSNIPNDIMSRWTYWMEQFNKLQVGLQIQAAALMQQAQLRMQMAMGQQLGQSAVAGTQPGQFEQGEQQQQPGGTPGSNGRPQGRPPTGGKLPHMENKDGGARTVISES